MKPWKAGLERGLSSAREEASGYFRRRKSKGQECHSNKEVGVFSD